MRLCSFLSVISNALMATLMAASSGCRANDFEKAKMAGCSGAKKNLAAGKVVSDRRLGVALSKAFARHKRSAAHALTRNLFP